MLAPHKYSQFFICLLISSIPLITQSAPPDAGAIKEAIQQSLETERKLNQPLITPLKPPQENTEEMPSLEALPPILDNAQESCYVFDKIITSGIPDTEKSRFSWLNEKILPYHSKCLNAASINQIIRVLNQELAIQGDAASQVALPAQNLNRKMLEFTFILGIVGEIKLTDPSDKNRWYWPLPLTKGERLDSFDILQGQKQMQRIPSQKVNITLQPTSIAGVNDVLITTERDKRWRANLSIDDAGAESTGKFIGKINLSLDNPLYLSDLINLGLSNNLDGPFNDHYTRTYTLNYSVPIGYWTISLNLTQNSYLQTVAGKYQQFNLTGSSTNSEIDIQRTIYRYLQSSGDLHFHIIKKVAHNFLDDTEILVQKRYTTAAQVSYTHQHNFNTVQFEFTLSHKQGVPWINGQTDNPTDPPDSPTFLYKINALDASLNKSFELNDHPWQYTANLHAQYTDSTLYGSEYISIGGRSTVRGFDGEQSLSARNGYYIRDELSWYFKNNAHSAYLGLDYGEVYGQDEDDRLGSQLTGFVVGIRGSHRWHGQWDWDFFIGAPINKPSGYKTADVTAGFRLATTF